MKKINTYIYIIQLLLIILILQIPKTIKQEPLNKPVFKEVEVASNSHIKINNTNIDFDMNKNPTKEDCLLLDYVNISDKKLLIRDDNRLLDDLNKYLNKDFYDNNKRVYITLQNEGYIYEVFSVFKTSYFTHTQLIFLNEEYENHIDYLVNNNIYDKTPIPKDSNIITITTSINDQKENFLVVNLRRI